MQMMFYIIYVSSIYLHYTWKHFHNFFFFLMILLIRELLHKKYRMVWIGRDLNDHLIQISWHKQGHLSADQAAQCPIQPVILETVAQLLKKIGVGNTAPVPALFCQRSVRIMSGKGRIRTEPLIWWVLLLPGWFSLSSRSYLLQLFER